MNKVVVVTAITASRDCLKERQATAGADFVAFSDRPLESSTWQVRPACDLFHDPVRNAKIHKALPHLYLPNYDYSLWIDGSIELEEPAPALVERYLADRDVVFGRHPFHRSFADEVTSVLREFRDDPDAVREQVASYGERDDDLDFPLATVVLRRHTPEVARFNVGWWSEICRWTRRDQLSVLTALAGSDVRWGCFERRPDLTAHPQHRLLGNPSFRWYPHGVDLDAQPPPRPALPTAAPESWWERRLEFLEVLSGQREAYALSLEDELRKRTEWAEGASRYAESLAAELGARERWAAEASRYAESLAAELGARGRWAAEASRYAASLEHTLEQRSREATDAGRYAQSLAEELARHRSRLEEAERHIRSLENGSR